MTDDELPDWDRIVERHAERVFRVALRILRSVQDAEDVSQDVFTEAFRVHKAGPVQSWTGLLVRLATLRSLDRLRRNRPTVELREGDRMSTVEPYEELAARELARLAAEGPCSTARPAGHGLRDAPLRATIARRSFRGLGRFAGSRLDGVVQGAATSC